MNAQAKTQTKIPHDKSKPAVVIAFGSPKGGPGKTTLAVAVAAELGRRAAGPVSLVDLDRTANALEHMSRQASTENAIPAKVHHLASLMSNSPALAAQLNEQKKSNQFLVLDSPGSVENPAAQFALTMADVCVVPMRPAAYDLQATMDCLTVLQRIRAVRPEHIQMIVINCPERTKIGVQTEAQARILAKDFDVVFCERPIKKSVAHQESAATGLPLWHLGSSAKPAEQNIVELVDDLLAQLASKKNFHQ